jgi:hypothetical protein
MKGSEGERKEMTGFLDELALVKSEDSEMVAAEGKKRDSSESSQNSGEEKRFELVVKGIDGEEKAEGVRSAIKDRGISEEMKIGKDRDNKVVGVIRFSTRELAEKAKAKLENDESLKGGLEIEYKETVSVDVSKEEGKFGEESSLFALSPAKTSGEIDKIREKEEEKGEEKEKEWENEEKKWEERKEEREKVEEKREEREEEVRRNEERQKNFSVYDLMLIGVGVGALITLVIVVIKVKARLR